MSIILIRYSLKREDRRESLWTLQLGCRKTRPTGSLVDEGLDQFGVGRDVRFGRSQERACEDRRAEVKLTGFPFSPKRTGVTAPRTQIVGHGDEAEAGDVGVVPGLVQLLLGRVVTGEALRRF